MSMLAERKRKQKWSLNPRGNTWSQDTNKFGQKLLEKMGWKEGKGLGAKEDGMKEHVKISYKNDSKGLGFKDKDGWTEHDDNFSALLQDLSNSEVTVKTEISSNTNEFKPKSLEKKSQNSRVRVHYHKFTRGKDLTRYSEKDLANIFGKRSLQNEKIAKTEEKNEDSSHLCNEKDDTNGFGVRTLEGGSMIDYFKSKMSALYKGSSTIQVKEGSSDNSDSYDELSTVGFGFTSSLSGNESNKGPHTSKKKYNRKSQDNFKENSSFSFESENETQLTENSTDDIKRGIGTPKKKSKKRKLEENTEVTPKQKKSESFLDELKQTFSSSVEKKKKKVINEDNIDDNRRNQSLGLSNLAFDPLFKENVAVNKQFLNTITEDEVSPDSDIITPIESKNKKRKKASTLDDDLQEVTDETSTIPKKKKKREKNKGFENPNFDIDQNCESNAEVDNNVYEVTSKKKKKNKQVGIENPAFSEHSPLTEEQNEIVNDDRYNPKLFKEHKKKSKKDLEIVGNALPIEDNDAESSQDLSEGFKPKRKSKKKKHNLNGIENPSLNISSSENSLEELSLGEQNIKEEMDNSEKQESYGSITSNSNFILNVSDEPDIMLNISFGLPDYLKQTNDTETMSKNDISPIKNNTKRRKSVRFSNVNEEREIPNRFDDYYSAINSQEKEGFDENLKNNSEDTSKNGLVNEGFDYRKDWIENNIQKISEKFDTFQAEIENNINEAKFTEVITKNIGVENVVIGEPVSDGENEKLEHGTKLRLKYADFGKVPLWMKNNNSFSYAKKSYRHLIKGDIVVQFKNTNLHEISGYGKEICNRSRLSNSLIINRQ